MFEELTEQDVHLLLLACFEAEKRCDQLVEEARARGETRSAIAAIQQKEQYEVLKRKIVADLQGDRSSLMEDSNVFSERLKKLLSNPPK
jgi:hypothetical protein